MLRIEPLRHRFSAVRCAESLRFSHSWKQRRVNARLFGRRQFRLCG